MHQFNILPFNEFDNKLTKRVVQIKTKQDTLGMFASYNDLSLFFRCCISSCQSAWPRIAVHYRFLLKLTKQRQFELKHFLNIIKSNIVSLQEIKLSKEEANLCLNFPEYSAYIRTRESNPKRGGGVAILIRSEIPHTPILG